MLMWCDKGYGPVTTHKVNHVVTMEFPVVINNDAKNMSAALTLESQLSRCVNAWKIIASIYKTSVFRQGKMKP